jgi:hypothetical protein
LSFGILLDAMAGHFRSVGVQALFALVATHAHASMGIVNTDVLVYSANPGGIGAAIAAADGGRNRVLVMEQLAMIGGMGAAGGVGLMNQGAGLAGVSGLGKVWATLNGAYYHPGIPDPPLNTFPDLFVAAASFWKMLNATPSITTRLGCRLTAANKSGDCFLSADFLCNNDTEAVTVIASMFIDASYDGEFMVAGGGIDYVSGREPSSMYNESLAGVSLLDEENESFDKQNLTIDAVFPNGTFLPGISSQPLPPAGSGDDRLMAFSYFPCLSSDPNNSVPYPMPVGYNPNDFILLQAQIEGVMANGMYPQGPDLSYFSEWQAYDSNASSPKLLLCCGIGPINCDEPDLNAGWANANHTEKLRLAALHKYYLLGSLYYMANDARVPNYTRYAIGRWGLCADEYVENEHWPPQLYIRISNRLQGTVLLTQNTLANPRSKPDGVSMGCWPFDQHTMSRHGVPDRTNASRLIAMNEGYMRNEISAPFRSCGAPGVLCDGPESWYDVPFGVIVPVRGQASNLLVPVAISSTSIAYASTRIEGMYMDLGTAAGVAVALALRAGAQQPHTSTSQCSFIPLQDTNVTAVQNILVNTFQQRIHGPVNTTLDGQPHE